MEKETFIEKDIKKELLRKLSDNFLVTDESQKYQAYPCHITKFQEECIRENFIKD